MSINISEHDIEERYQKIKNYLFRTPMVYATKPKRENKTPSVASPYSQAIKLDTGFLYLSGQLGLDPKTMQLADTIEKQTIQLLKNIDEILKIEQYNKNNIIKTTIFLKDITDFAKVNLIYESFFNEHKPARSAIAVKDLPKDASIMIEVIAFK